MILDAPTSRINVARYLRVKKRRVEGRMKVV